MNQDQTYNLIQKIIVLLGGYFIAKGVGDHVLWEALAGGVPAVVTWYISHKWNGTPNPNLVSLPAQKGTGVLVALATLLALGAHAQTNLQQSFFNQVFTWGTSFDTNSVTFLNTRGMFDTGVESRTGDGVPLINDLHASYDLVASTNATSFRFGPDLLERNSGVAGTFLSTQGGLQVAEVHYDFRFGAAIDGGYWANSPTVRHRLFGEISLNAEKALGSRTYTGLRFSQEFPRNAQGIYAQLGFTF
jgi:hypothetical protein